MGLNWCLTKPQRNWDLSPILPADLHGKIPQIKPIKSAYFFSLDQRNTKLRIHNQEKPTFSESIPKKY
jgi:hypothetical protein